jgi:hypothetical protein
LFSIFLVGCYSKNVRDPILNITGYKKQAVHQSLDQQPVIYGTLREKDLEYEVYFRRSCKKGDWSSDMSHWILIYKDGNINGVYEGFDEVPEGMGGQIRQHYVEELRRKRSLEIEGK